MMIHPGLAALNGHWNKDEYAAGYQARLTAIPDFDGAHHCWRVGWEDADTEMLELARHRKALAEGREDDYPETWGLLFDAGGDARVNASPSTTTERHLGRRVGSKQTSTLECMG